MKFNLNIFGFKKTSGQVEILHVIPEIVEDREELFNKAVKEAAIESLARDIRYELDCIAWGKDRVDQTLEASKTYEAGKLYPLATFSSGYFTLPRNHWSLAEALAKKWVEENYNK